jgi:hypothetical protein
LVLVLGLPLCASLFQAQAEQAGMPACCRRSGAHRCMAGMGTRSGQPVAHAVCSMFPHAAASAQTGVWSMAGEQQASAKLDIRPAVVGQVEAGYRISFGRARQKRGPPTLKS